MADFKVSFENVKIHTHPNADSLEVGVVGEFQIVVQKGLYKDGDLVCFAPKRSIIPEELRPEFPFLGSDGRVKSIKLRGELSEGICLPLAWVDSKIPKDKQQVGEDVSAALGIQEWNPFNQGNVTFGADVEYLPDVADRLARHDCSNHRLIRFAPDTMVEVTEKLHGSQIIVSFQGDRILISSKGQLKRGLFLKPSPSNVYWRAWEGYQKEVLENPVKDVPDGTTLYGEVIPCQGGDWSYGMSTPTIRFFRVETPDPDWKPILLMPPALYRGLFKDMPADLHTGKENVSGKSLHIREGCVIRGVGVSGRETKMCFAKVINPKFKGDDEDLS